ncbi:MAG: NTP transferase domain-containing protein [Clostridium sp.]
MDIYRTVQIVNEENLSQREMASRVGVSLGKMNMLINKCISDGYIIKNIKGSKVKYLITDRGFELLKDNLDTIKEEKVSITRDSYKKVKSAVILAAGRKKDFNVSPAGLKVNGDMIINTTIRNLKMCGIEKIVVVLGYGKNEIKNNLIDSENIVIVESDNYENTGSMSSLILVTPFINEDFILVEGDVYFEIEGVKMLLEHTKRECLMITDISNSGDEGFVQLKNKCLFKLGKDIHQFNRVDGEMIGITRVSYKLFDLMVKEYQENINPLLNYEYILLDVSRDFKVSCLKVKDFKWAEVDNKDQYNNLINKFKEN